MVVVVGEAPLHVDRKDIRTDEYADTTFRGALPITAPTYLPLSRYPTVMYFSPTPMLLFGSFEQTRTANWRRRRWWRWRRRWAN